MEVKTTEEVSQENAANIRKGLDEFLNWGHINFESANGVIQSNCRAIGFAGSSEQIAAAMNEYFEKHPGTFAAQIFTDGGGTIAIVNRTMTEEDQAILADSADVIRDLTAQRKKARDDAKLKEEEELKARVAKLEELQKLGEKCVSNHGAVIEDNSKLKKENESLRKQLKKALK